MGFTAPALCVLVLAAGALSSACKPGTIGTTAWGTPGAYTTRTDPDPSTCEASPSCVGWLWDPVSGGQTLFTSVTSMTVTTSATDGCSGINECIGRDDATGPVIPGFASVAVSRTEGSWDCAKLCRTTPGCSAFTSCSGKCTLRYSLGNTSRTYPGMWRCSAPIRCLQGAGVDPTLTIATPSAVTGGDLECGSRCRKTAGCAGWTIDSTTIPPTCALKSRVDVRDTRPAMAGVCLSALQCKQGLGVAGEKLQSVAVRDDVECARLCGRAIQCTGWAFRQNAITSGECTIFSGWASPYTPRNASINANVCGHLTQCRGASTMTGTVLSTIKVLGGDAECLNRCLWTEKCSGFSVNFEDPAAQQTCTLFAKGTLQPASGASCAAPLRCLALSKHTGTLMATLTVSSGDAECSTQCATWEGCVGYTVTTSYPSKIHMQQCNLFSSIASTATSALPGGCSATLRCVAARGSTGTEFGSADVAGGDAECASLCSSTNGCVSWSLDTATPDRRMQTCRLRSSFGQLTQDMSRCSGRLQCQANMVADGSDIGTPITPPQGGEAACAAQCRATDACVGYVYADDKCQLKSSITNARQASGSCLGTLRCANGKRGAVLLQTTAVTGADIECEELCLRNVWCLAFSVSGGAFNQSCSLYSTQETEDDPTSCYSALPCMPGVTSTNYISLGAPAAVGGPAECRARCLANSQCVNYLLRTGVIGQGYTCELQSTLGGSRADASACIGFRVR